MFNQKGNVSYQSEKNMRVTKKSKDRKYKENIKKYKI